MSNTDDPELTVEETGVLRKFDGDLTDEEMETAEPVEEIVINLKTNEIIKRTVRGEVQ